MSRYRYRLEADGRYHAYRLDGEVRTPIGAFDTLEAVYARIQRDVTIIEAVAFEPVARITDQSGSSP
jgi:hypothetical protein